MLNVFNCVSSVFSARAFKNELQQQLSQSAYHVTQHMA